MKSHFLTVLSIVLVLVPGVITAQKVTHEIGIVTGLNYFIRTNNIQEIPPKSQVRPLIGIAYQARFTKHFSMKTNIIYNRVVAKQEIDFSGYRGYPGFPAVKGTQTKKHENIFIPILVNWSFGEKTKFFISAGPSWKKVFNVRNTFDNGSYKEYYGESDGRTYIQWNLGCGVSIPLSDRLVVNGELMGSIPTQHYRLGNFYLEGVQTILLVGVSYKLGSGKQEE